MFRVPANAAKNRMLNRKVSVFPDTTADDAATPIWHWLFDNVVFAPIGVNKYPPPPSS